MHGVCGLTVETTLIVDRVDARSPPAQYGFNMSWTKCRMSRSPASRAPSSRQLYGTHLRPPTPPLKVQLSNAPCARARAPVPGQCRHQGRSSLRAAHEGSCWSCLERVCVAWRSSRRSDRVTTAGVSGWRESHRPVVSSELLRLATRETGAVHFFARSRCGPLAQNSTDVQKWSRAHTATLGSRVLAGSSFRSGCDVEMRSTEVAQSSHQLRCHSQAS